MENLEETVTGLILVLNVPVSANLNLEDGEKAGAGLISGKHNGVPNALNVQVSICKNCMSIYR